LSYDNYNQNKIVNMNKMINTFTPTLKLRKTWRRYVSFLMMRKRKKTTTCSTSSSEFLCLCGSVKECVLVKDYCFSNVKKGSKMFFIATKVVRVLIFFVNISGPHVYLIFSKRNATRRKCVHHFFFGDIA